MKHVATLFLSLLCGCALPYRAAHTSNTTEFFQGRPDGLVCRVKFKDVERGGCASLLADPKTQSISAFSTNRFSSHVFTMGETSIVLDPQASSFVRAIGEAAGAAAGEAAKVVLGKP